MLIKKINISGYKNLNIEWDLKKSGNIVAVLGKNASGKTNLFEAIIGLSNVADDSEKVKANFKGEIEFCVDNQIIWVNENGVYQKKPIKIKGRKGQDKACSEAEVPDIIRISLPDDFCSRSFVASRRFYKYISEENKFSYYNEIKYGDEFSNFILFLFSISPDYDIRKLIKEIFNIESISSFKFKVASEKEINKLKEPTKTYFNIVKDYTKSEKVEDVGNYEFSEIALMELADAFGNEQDFFDALHYLSQSETLKVDPFNSLEVHKQNKSIKIKDLSDGEKQLLYILAIIRYYMGKNVVLLFDEPDTHIYPTLQMNLIKYIEKLDDKMNIIIATHSPYVVSSLKNENVFYIDNGEIYNVGYTKGKDINSIMANIFNTPIRPYETQKTINDIYDIVEKEKLRDEEIDNAKRMIDSIAKDLGEDDAEIVTMRALLNSRSK